MALVFLGREVIGHCTKFTTRDVKECHCLYILDHLDGQLINVVISVVVTNKLVIKLVQVDISVV